MDISLIAQHFCEMCSSTGVCTDLKTRICYIIVEGLGEMSKASASITKGKETACT